MNSTILSICFVLLIFTWVLVRFRRRLAPLIGRHPQVTKVLAVLLALVLFILALSPLIIWFFNVVTQKN